MAEQQRQSLCPRLIDYLAIVGSRSPNIKCTGNSQSPPVQVIQSKNQNLKLLFNLNLSLGISWMKTRV